MSRIRGGAGGAVLAMAMLGACAVGPDYHAPAFDLPADWSTARNERDSPARIEDLSQWWTRFEDPVLNDLITRAIENNPDRAAALASIREARARAKIAGASRYPAVDAGGGLLAPINPDRQTGTVFTAPVSTRVGKRTFLAASNRNSRLPKQRCKRAKPPMSMC